MGRRLRGVLLITLPALLLWSSVVSAAGVHALFDLEVPTGGPFPSDRFTVSDPGQETALRVSLPKPNCTARPSDCADLDVINTLDGFNLSPRLSIPFDGPIDPSTVSSQTVILIGLGDARLEDTKGGKVVGINQVVWDPVTNTLHAKSDELLEQHTRYALVVTRGVRDAAGDQVEASTEFNRFRHDLNFGGGTLKDYRKALLDALAAARRAGIRSKHIVVASVFTTQSATAILEKIRDQIKATTPARADFLLGPSGTRTVFPLTMVTGVTFNAQLTIGPTLTPIPAPVAALGIIPGAVGTIAFGKYRSPDYETAQRFIPPIVTQSGVPVVQAANEIFFNLVLPAGPKPLNGWPVAIFGHGFTDNKNNSPFVVAATMAAHGIATIAINVVGHGFGGNGTLTVSQAGGSSVTIPAGGRGIDLDGNGIIDSTEGVSAVPPQTIIASRDGLRQTVVDLMQLVRVIEVGVDVDGDGVPDLDRTRIYYFGQSFGGIYGTIFLGVESSVKVGVPNVPGGSVIEVARLGGFRPLVGIALASRIPSLINVADPSGIAFNENLPLRDQPSVINTVPGAIEIQEVLENTEWVSQSGNPVAYAPHLRMDPLDGVEAKSVIVQFARGDQTVPNPTTTAILRAGDLADRATFFRNDLAFAANPATPKNPHTFLTRINVPAVAGIALAAQEQIAVFFASDGTITTDPGPLFEVPIVPPLPEDLAFIP
jgi:Big-like domain-containing protein